ncbi:virB8 family protein [Sphingosinicella sp. BN140058]|uniref:virB8 family protein n=1 Tax=Sphingosinicella sp. BN140058 TaxID=1892855 RepID=UPI0013ED8428|nr:type IV secretion system protein [Sphingosinicella sp. BN140058]
MSRDAAPEPPVCASETPAATPGRPAYPQRGFRIGLIVASGAALVALCGAFALALFVPMKTATPVMLLVDRRTGHVQAIGAGAAGTGAADAVLRRSLLVQYTVARESFDRDILQHQYRKVSSWSAGPARADYVRTMEASNPDSPLRRITRNSVVEVNVESMTDLGPDVAMVRFDTVRRDANNRSERTGTWAALLRYRFGADLPPEQRFTNPLGFQVVRYRRDPEVLPGPESPVTPAPRTGSRAVAPEREPEPASPSAAAQASVVPEGQESER